MARRLKFAKAIKTGKRIVAKECHYCHSILSKALGLMFSKKKNLLMIFPKEQRISLHMVFVFFPIWVLYVNSKKKVVHIEKLLPFVSATYPKPKAKYIFELTHKPNVKVGSKVSW